MSYDVDQTVRPLLILTSTAFLLPVYKFIVTGYYIDHPYQFMSQVFFFLISILFHSTRLHVFLVLDRLAIANHVVLGIIVIHQQTAKEILVFWTCMAYGMVSYVIGAKYSVFAFDPNFYIQQFWHALNHFFIAYVSWVIVR
jgi:hypothetical protein